MQKSRSESLLKESVRLDQANRNLRYKKNSASNNSNKRARCLSIQLGDLISREGPKAEADLIAVRDISNKKRPGTTWNPAPNWVSYCGGSNVGHVQRSRFFNACLLVKLPHRF